MAHKKTNAGPEVPGFSQDPVLTGAQGPPLPARLKGSVPVDATTQALLDGIQDLTGLDVNSADDATGLVPTLQALLSDPDQSTAARAFAILAQMEGAFPFLKGRLLPKPGDEGGTVGSSLPAGAAQFKLDNPTTDGAAPGIRDKAGTQNGGTPSDKIAELEFEFLLREDERAQQELEFSVNTLLTTMGLVQQLEIALGGQATQKWIAVLQDNFARAQAAAVNARFTASQTQNAEFAQKALDLELLLTNRQQDILSAKNVGDLSARMLEIGISGSRQEADQAFQEGTLASQEAARELQRELGLGEQAIASRGQDIEFLTTLLNDPAALHTFRRLQGENPELSPALQRLLPQGDVSQFAFNPNQFQNLDEDQQAVFGAELSLQGISPARLARGQKVLKGVGQNSPTPARLAKLPKRTPF